MPGFGQSPENTRTRSMPELASTMAQAAKNARPRHLQPHGHLVRGQDGPLAGAPGAGAGARPGAGSSRGDPPGRRAIARGYSRGDGALALRSSRAAPGLPGARPGRAGEDAGAGAAIARARPRRGPRGSACRSRRADPRPVRHPGSRHRPGHGAHLQGADPQLPPGVRLRRRATPSAPIGRRRSPRWWSTSSSATRPSSSAARRR